jgi:hypothetical protein
MLREAEEHLKKNTSLEKVFFVLLDAQALSEFEKVRAEMGSGGELQGASGAGSK